MRFIVSIAKMDEESQLYVESAAQESTHISLRWKGRVRYTVPHAACAQRACWNTFRPGLLGAPLRAMASFPRLSAAIPCVEGGAIKIIRNSVPGEVGPSCCRSGAAGPCHKKTLVLLDSQAIHPLYFAKVGSGAAVDALLQNEALWLRKLSSVPELAPCVPVLVANRTGEDLCFLLQQPLSGKLGFRLGAIQFEFLKKLQQSFSRAMNFRESKLHSTIESRFDDMKAILSRGWSTRIEKALLRINQAFSTSSILLVAAHNDFTPWNIRLQNGVAAVFDWEYAADEQLPLFDPLHFVLLPMALKRLSAKAIVAGLHATIAACRQPLSAELCQQADAQALAYLVNVCTLYLWSNGGNPGSDPVLQSYGAVLDRLSAGA